MSRELRYVSVLCRALPVADEHRVELHIEVGFNPASFAAFLARIEHPMLKANWDRATLLNSDTLPPESSRHMALVSRSIHLKDRYRKPEGGVETRPLGCGSADFSDVFRAIGFTSYSGGLTLQAARGCNHDEVRFIRTQLCFVK